MNTTMQDMIDFLTKKIDMCHDNYEQKINISWIKFYAEYLIEDEKKQIIEAFEEGLNEMSPYIKAEHYYDETYNQNK